MDKLKLVDTADKSKVLNIRVSEALYQALEKMAESSGGTVSAFSRQVLCQAVDIEDIALKPGDTLKSSTDNTEVFFMLVGSETSGGSIQKRIDNLKSGSQAYGVVIPEGKEWVKGEGL